MAKEVRAIGFRKRTRRETPVALAAAVASLALGWSSEGLSGEANPADPARELDRAIESGEVLATFDAIEVLASAVLADSRATEGSAARGAPSVPRAAEGRVPSQPSSKNLEETLVRAFEAKSAWVRRGGLRALGATGGERAGGVVLRALEDQDALVRLDACGVAARVRVPPAMLARIIAALAARLLDERDGIRAEAARALGALAERHLRQTEPPAAMGPAADALMKAEEPLRVAVFRDRDPTTRAAAVEALACLAAGQVHRRLGPNDPAGDRGFDVVSRTLTEDEDERVREAAARSLVLFPPEQVVEKLSAATRDVSGRVRVTAAAALGAIGTDDAVAALVRTLALKDEDLRSEATSALGRVGSPAALEALRALVAHDAGEVRREAAQALGHLADTASMERLARLASDPRADVRASAVEALGRFADPRAAAVVRMRLSDRDAEVRARAAEAAGRIGDLEATSTLVELLRPEFSDGERVAAATALGFLGDLRVADRLALLLDDGSEHVRRASASALSHLGAKGDALLLHEAAFAGPARVEFLGALALLRVGLARHFFTQELARSRGDARAVFACEVGLFLLGDGTRRQAVLDGARSSAGGGRPGANPALALVALVLARDPEAESCAREALESKDPSMRESAALALGVARPAWGEELLHKATSDRSRAVALRARIALRWLQLRGPRD